MPNTAVIDQALVQLQPTTLLVSCQRDFDVDVAVVYVDKPILDRDLCAEGWIPRCVEVVLSVTDA
jgi:hypothetical protein